MVDITKKARLTGQAADEILSYLESLLEDVVIDEIPAEHHPVRRALTLYDPIESSHGNRLPFSLYKRALEDVESGVESVFGVEFPTGGDLENNGFATQVRELTNQGMSEDEAVGGLAGGFNLDMLAEGVIPVFRKMIEDLFPAAPLGEIGGDASPLGDYMSAGLPNDQGGSRGDLLAVSEQVDTIKNILKGSLGLQTNYRREAMSNPNKIVSYGIAAALSKTGEFSPAKIWHAWSIYHEVRKISVACRDMIANPIQEKSFISISVGGSTVDSKSAHIQQLDAFNRTLREYNVLMTNTLSNSALCCLVGGLLKLDNARSIISGIKGMLSMVIQLNKLNINAEIGSYANPGAQIRNALVSRGIRKIDARVKESKEFLQKSYSALASKIDDCIVLDQLFLAMIGVVNKMRQVAVGMLRKFSNQFALERRSSYRVNQTLMENWAGSSLLGLIEQIERILDQALKCDLDDDSRDSRLLDLIQQNRNTGASLRAHLSGQPIPDGIDPEYPLLNLVPIVTENDFVIQPGIQGVEIPTGELRELFDSCRRGQHSDNFTWQTLAAMIRRRNS